MLSLAYACPLSIPYHKRPAVLRTTMNHNLTNLVGYTSRFECSPKIIARSIRIELYGRDLAGLNGARIIHSRPNQPQPACLTRPPRRLIMRTTTA